MLFHSDTLSDLHSDTFYWFRDNRYLLLLLNATGSLVWPDWGSNTYLLHWSSECLSVHLTGVVFGIHQNEKKWSTFQGNIYCRAKRLFYEGRVVFIRLKIVNEFLWENVRRIELESTQGVIRIRKSKDRQHNSQKKRDKRTNTDLQSIHTKPKIT
jgi:hypothetical protein